MNQIDINTLAQRANQMTNEPGFLRCYVSSSANRELAFEFDTTTNAHGFMMRQTNLNMQAVIPSNQQNIVLVKYP